MYVVVGGYWAYAIPMDGTEEVSGSLYCPIHAEKMRSLDNEFDPDNKVGKWTEEYKAALDTLSASEGGAQEGRDE